MAYFLTVEDSPQHAAVSLKWTFRIGLLLVCCLSFLAGNTCYCHADSQENVSDAAAISKPIISEILVEIRDVRDTRTKWIEMARGLIFFREGDRFSAARLDKSIAALRLCDRFHEIDVDVKEKEDGIALLFCLTPFRLIKDIRIEGKYPVFEREILNAMTIYSGDAFIQEELPKQQTLIEELFQREGFISPNVEVTAIEDRDDGCFVIHVRIDKGPYYRLRLLEIDGDRAFSDARLKLKMKTWRATFFPGSSGRFIEGDIKKDIKNLTGFYRKKGYADALIDLKVEENAGTKSVSVFVTIDEGPKYEVEFVGNKQFWDLTLKKDMVLFQEGNRNDLGVKKSVRRIKERYRSAGYLQTHVKIEEKAATDQDEPIRMLRFVIDEGPRSIVRSIRIAGNTQFDDEKIKKQMLTRLPGLLHDGAFVPETLADDVDAITSLYLKQGYMDTQVKEKLEWNKEKTGVDVNLKIEEGVQALVSSGTVTGVNLLSKEETRNAISLKKGEPFRRYMIKSDENALSALISEKGHPYVKVKGEVSISEDQSRAEVVYRVDEGPFVEMGPVYYKGNFRTKVKILQNELELQPGEPFSLVKMLDGQRNLRNMDIFNSAKFKAIGLKEKRKRIDLFVEVEEKKPYFVEIGGGYESEKRFFAHTKIGDRNLLGTNKTASLGGELSQIGYRGEFKIKEPRLIGSHIAADLSLYAERKEEFNQNFGTTTYGSSIGFARKWSERLTTSLSFQFEQKEQFRRDSQYSETETLEYDSDQFIPRSILVATPLICYNTRDSFIRPRRGTFSTLSVDISKGLRNSLDDFVKYRLDLRYYFTPLSRLTFACLGRTGYIEPYGSTGRVPDDQLFFLGGTSSVRGFKENLLCFDAQGDAVGGRVAVNGSVEARIYLGLDLELDAFFDTGRVSDTFEDACSGSGEFRSSAGLGLRYITPIGAIGVLYGRKLDPKEGESRGRFHFSIGYTF